MLEQGKTIEEISRITSCRLMKGYEWDLPQVREIQSDLISGIAEQTISAEIALPLIDLANPK